MQLARVADQLVTDEDLRAPAGVPRGDGTGDHRARHRAPGPHRATGLDRIGPARRTTRPPPSGGFRSPPTSTARCSGWAGSAASSSFSSSTLGRRSTASWRRPAALRPAGRNTAPTSKARGRPGRGRCCARASSSEAGQSVVRSSGSWSESGLRSTRYRRPARVVERRAARPSRLADEREGERLDVARTGEREADPAAELLARGQAGARPARQAARWAPCHSRRAGRPPRRGHRGR